MNREQFEANEKRERIFESAGWKCGSCGGNIRDGIPQLAHRIAATKSALKKYGKAVIHHELNLVPACSLRCNAIQNIGFIPDEVSELVDEIRNTIKEKR